MRLLITIPNFCREAGGAESFAVTVSQGLASRGHEMHVAALTGEATNGIIVHKVSSLADAEKLRAEIKPDLVLDWGLNIRADVHRLGGGTHREFLHYKLLASHYLLRPFKAIDLRLRPKHRCLIAAERKLLADPQARYIAVSNFVKKQLQNIAAIDDARIRVLHNGVDVARMQRECGARALRPELGIGENDIFCLFVAHNLQLKNFALLRRIFQRLYPHIPELKLVVLGKHRPRTQADWLVYAGAVEDPTRFYQAADILLHPTYYDACSNTVLEALAAECVVISSDLNGSAEIISSGDNGFVLPVTQGESLRIWSDLIARLAQDRRARQKISRAASELARQCDIQNYLTRLENVLTEFTG